MAGGSPGVIHGMRTYLLQDSDGQTLPTHSVSAGLDYPLSGRGDKDMDTVARWFGHVTDDAGEPGGAGEDSSGGAGGAGR